MIVQCNPKKDTIFRGYFGGAVPVLASAGVGARATHLPLGTVPSAMVGPDRKHPRAHYIGATTEL
jgi:hypothetical protein